MSKEALEIRNLAYENPNRGLKEHELVMIEHVKNNMPNIPLDILDIGCADGVFVKELCKEINCNRIDGIDNDPILIDAANLRKYEAKHSCFYCDDIQKMIDNKHEINRKSYDVIIASGVLPCFDDYDGIIKVLTNSLNKEGKLFIFGSHLSRPVDLRYSIRSQGEEEWEFDRTVLSLGSLESILQQYLKNITKEKFEIPFDLEEKESICSSYSLKKEDGARLVLTRFNVMTEMVYIIGEKND